MINALMHRDCHSTAAGRPAMMALYPDRLEVSSPGGLYGAFDPDRLMTEPVTAARNARLAKLLQDVAGPGSPQTVCENVGTGLLSAAQNLRARAWRHRRSSTHSLTSRLCFAITLSSTSTPSNGSPRSRMLDSLRTLENQGLVRTTRPGRRSRNQLWERAD